MPLKKGSPKTLKSDSDATSAKVSVLRVTRVRAARFGWYPSSTMDRSTRARRSAATVADPLTTRDTVARDTPAWAPTCSRLGRADVTLVVIGRPPPASSPQMLLHSAWGAGIIDRPGCRDLISQNGFQPSSTHPRGQTLTTTPIGAAVTDEATWLVLPTVTACAIHRLDRRKAPLSVGICLFRSRLHHVGHYPCTCCAQPCGQLGASVGDNSSWRHRSTTRRRHPHGPPRLSTPAPRTLSQPTCDPSTLSTPLTTATALSLQELCF